MTLTKQQVDEMLTAAIPLMAWISDNCHPHCMAQVNGQSVELVEGIARNFRQEG